MDYKKELLIKSAARLYSLGLDLEGAKERIRKLVADGVGYETPEMVEAAREFTAIKELWDNLEREYLMLRKDLIDESWPKAASSYKKRQKEGINMKRVLRFASLILAVVMLVSVMPYVSATTNPFTDIRSGVYYYDPVLWAVATKITAGTSATTFSPDSTCTRGQIVTFLWRSSGEPEPNSTSCPFNDVKSGMYYYKAVLWAVENKITAGTSATTFSPDAGCTRGQVVTFLYRAQGSPVPASSSCPFSDVKAGTYYYNAVLWAVENKITAGTSITTFSPDSTCTRGQIVTFLYRALLLNDFAADEVYFPAGQSTIITFTVNSSDISGKTIGLYANDGNYIAKMHDDGINGDAVANDKVYSCRISKTTTEAYSSTYYASITGSAQSNKDSVYFFEQPSEQAIQKDKDITEGIMDIESGYADNTGFVPQAKTTAALDAVESYAKELQEAGDVICYEKSENGIIIKLSSGLSVYYSPNVAGVDSIGADVSMTVITCQPCLSMYSGLDSQMALPDKAALEIGKTFNNYSYSTANNYDNGGVTLERIKSFNSNQIVLWHGHGGYGDSYHSCLLTGEDFDWNAWWWDITYWWDCVQDRILESSGGRAMITAKYVKKYCGNLNNSFFYLAACESGRDSVLADAFLNKGAAAVIANTETIYTEYNLLMEYEVAHNLTQINSVTENYYTLGEALSAAKAKHGNNDLAWYTGSNPKAVAAEPIIFGGEEAESYRLANASSSIPAEAATYNGHYYMLYNDANSFDNAQQKCIERGGHLATLTSSEEDTFVYSYIKSNGVTSAYFGFTDAKTEGNWEWVTGEPVEYTNWASGEPNAESSQEDYGMYYYKFSTGKWNDGRGPAVGSYYICEWDTDLSAGICLADLECVDEGHYTGNMGDARVYRLDAKEFIGYSPKGYNNTTTRNGNLGVDGTVFENGFEAWIARWNYGDNISWAYRTFKLGGSYHTLSGSSGIIKSYNTTNYDVTAYFYSGDELLYSFRMTPSSNQFDYTIDVTGVDELKVLIQDNIKAAGGTSYALYNLFLH